MAVEYVGRKRIRGDILRTLKAFLVRNQNSKAGMTGCPRVSVIAGIVSRSLVPAIHVKS